MSRSERGIQSLAIRWFVLLLAGVAGGCEATASPSETYAVRDSAGVRIVESSAPAWSEGEAWLVADTPSLHIGVVEGAPEYQFSIIAGVWRLDDGRIRVGDARSVQIRTYAADGTFLSAFGDQGEGPGEFRLLTRAGPFRGDSIVAWGGQRVAIFDADGRLGRTLTPTFPASEALGTGSMSLRSMGGLIDSFADGTLLAGAGVSYSGEPGEVVTGDQSYLRYSADGESLGEVYVASGRTLRLPPPPGSRTVQVDPYRPASLVAVDGDGLYTGASSAFEIEHRGYDGTVDLVIRDFHRDLTLDEAAREAFREQQRQSSRGQEAPEEMELALRDVEFPTTIPPYTQALVDSEDHLWVRHYPIPGSTIPEIWSVFAPEGHLLGTVETPPRLQVREIGPDYLLGIWTDELDVRHIRMYALTR